MIGRALDAGTSFGWIAGDDVYGNHSRLREWLEGRLSCAHREEKTPDREVPLSVPELRHLLWRGWLGVEHLLHWSGSRRRHPFHALRSHYRKRGSPLPAFSLQLKY